MKGNGIKRTSYRRLNIIANSIQGVEIEDRIYNNGDVLFEQGTTARGLFFIEFGTILVSTIGSNGKDVVIRTVGANNFIGFLSLVRETKYTANAIAVEDGCRVRFIAKELFREALKDNRFANGFIKILSDRIMSIEDHIIDMKTKSVRQRIATVLLSFENAFDRTNDEETFISLKKKDIAAIVGTTPETLSRRLAEFENEGVIELHIRGIKIVDHSLLVRIANISD